MQKAKHLINPQVYKGPTSIGPHQFTISIVNGTAYSAIYKQKYQLNIR